METHKFGLWIYYLLFGALFIVVGFSEKNILLFLIGFIELVFLILINHTNILGAEVTS